MDFSGQQITKQTYEDPEVVAGYIKRNSLQPKQSQLLKTFSQSIKGNKVLDLGCGPGHDSYLFSELGFEVTAIDYSTEMIKQAKKFKEVSNKPKFIVGDIRKLTEYFSKNTFDAIWASASLLHIRKQDIHAVLEGITKIAKPGAKIYVGVKAGTGTVLIDEDKFGKETQREFTLWTKETFLEQVTPLGWKLDDFLTDTGSVFLGKPTKWLQFFFSL